ncbi:hypothetical protein ADUPG1_003589, partial [Aduncisulcus paluster]
VTNDMLEVLMFLKVFIQGNRVLEFSVWFPSVFLRFIPTPGYEELPFFLGFTSVIQ